MENVLIVDVETTGLDREKDSVIEYAYVLWSVKHRTIIECHSVLLPASSNAAQAVNGIPAAALPTAPDQYAWEPMANEMETADAIVAHQADFDRAFCDRYINTEQVWICTREDMKWPRAGAGESLIATALAHGCAVVAAHRAINDCLLLARLFEAVPDIAERLEAARQHALLPKARLVSLAPFEQKDIVKEHGFKWDPGRREWWRYMCVADAVGLPFRTKETREVATNG